MQRTRRLLLLLVPGLGMVLPGVALPGLEVTLKGHSGWVGALAFSPDGNTLATAGSDRTIRLWDPATGELKAMLEGHTDCVAALAFSPSGAILATGGYDGTVRTWDLSRGDPRLTITRDDGVVALSVAFSPDGAMLASGCIDGTIRLWDLSSGRGRALRGHRTWVNSVAFSPAGRKNGAASSRVTSVLASGSSDGEVKLWDPAKEKVIGSFDVRSGEVRCVAFAPDGTALAAGVRYGTARILKLPSLTEKATLKGHVSDVWSVAFSPDGSLLATGDGDWNQPGEVKLWDAATWKERSTLRHTGEVLCLAFDPKGLRLAAGSWDRTVKIWDIPRPPQGDSPLLRGAHKQGR